uniref:Guanylate cyclase n=1 Tax=Timema bartmani TaxID=61472 RepID=A0A7R9EVC7_9NEOP|nr:unnamed protein product [Timema bartmani]
MLSHFVFMVSDTRQIFTSDRRHRCRGPEVPALGEVRGGRIEGNGRLENIAIEGASRFEYIFEAPRRYAWLDTELIFLAGWTRVRLLRSVDSGVLLSRTGITLESGGRHLDSGLDVYDHSFSSYMTNKCYWEWSGVIFVQELAILYGLNITAVYQLSELDYVHTSHFIQEVEKIVTETYHRTRVYVFVGEHFTLVDLVACLQQRKLLDNGDYIIISVDDEIYDPKRRLSIVFREYLDPHLRNSTKSNNIIGFRSVPVDAAHLYDAVMIYARALTEVFENGDDPRDGSAILKRIRNRSYHSVQGYDVYIDNNGDAEGNYTVVALLEDTSDDGTVATWSMQPVGYFHDSNLFQEFRYLNAQRPFQWVGGHQPRAEPLCGFFGERCVYRTDWRITAPLCILLALAAVAAVFSLRHYRYEQRLACLLWKIDIKEIQVCRHSVFQAPGFNLDQSDLGSKRAYIKIGLYRGNIVAIKKVYKRHIDITRNIRKELNQIREVRHENLISFIGACVDYDNICVLIAYCARGSLEDVLGNNDLHLDTMFVSSLVADILKGMIYLHDSEIISHGNLRSSNCLVDSRWVLQITDFGLHEFKAGQEEPNSKAKENKRLLWRAPELLRHPAAPARGTQKADVYSFAIVLYEIVGRAGPWGTQGLSESEIVSRVRCPPDGQLFRPPIDHLDLPDFVEKCMRCCWDEEPEQRPDIRYIRILLKEMHTGLKANIFDNMLAIMEKYAYNLESIVQERTNQLTEEKKKTEALLHRMLPKTVAESLKRGEPVEAESFDSVSIYFSDIVGFTELSAVSTPMQVVELLNDLYTCCDSIISHYDVYKVETIGDAYMVVSGLPVRNGDRHAEEVASMALHLLDTINTIHIRHHPTEKLMLRIGVHSGQCVAGVVGLKMPRYCLFGDTVNTASRMESSGEALKIHMSETTKQLLDRLGGYLYDERGLTFIKVSLRLWDILDKGDIWR